MPEPAGPPFDAPRDGGEPPVPEPPPRVPRGRLWLCLLMPTLVTLLSVAVAVPVASSMNNYGGIPVLLATLLVGPVVGLCCIPWWLKLMRPRYAGRSLVLLGVAYPLGQIILTPFIAYGGCFLTFGIFGG